MIQKGCENRKEKRDTKCSFSVRGVQVLVGLKGNGDPLLFRIFFTLAVHFIISLSLGYFKLRSPLKSICKVRISLHFGTEKKWKLFQYLAYFCYYLWAPLHFLALFMDLTVLFQLTFTFIYSTFNNNFLVSTN